MKISEHKEMEKWLTRPSRKVLETKAKKEMGIPDKVDVNGSKILQWINYNNKITGNNNLPITEEEKQVAKDIEAYQNPPEAKDKETLKREIRIANAKGYIKKPKNKKDKWTYESWADGLEERTRPKKKIIKKTLITEKPKPTIQQQLEFEDYLNTLDPYWWIEDEPEDKVSVREPRSTAQGIQTILNLQKRKIT